MIEGYDIAVLEEYLTAAVRDLDSRTAAVANARQVQKFAVSMEKALVAKYTVKYLELGKSSAAAKTMALAHPDFIKEHADLRAVFQNCQEVIEGYEVARVKFEAARSLLSTARAQLPAAFQSQRHIT